jgi:hypothetical protein
VHVGLIKFVCVGVGVNHNELRLRVEESSGQSLYLGALFLHFHIGEELIGRVSEPHGLDITGDYVGGLILGSQDGVRDGGVEGVRVAKLEHTEQLGVLHNIRHTILSLNDSMYVLRHSRVSLRFSPRQASSSIANTTTCRFIAYIMI